MNQEINSGARPIVTNKLAREILLKVFDAAVMAAKPEAVLKDHLPDLPQGKVIVVGAGKGSAAMARELEKSWPGKVEGLVVTRYGHSVSCESIEIVEASHPVPDQNGLEAARRIKERVEGLSKDDLVICLLSGGGSALLSLPLPGITLEEKQAVTTALLHSGATIDEINCVRKHISAVKGGRLAAAAYPAKVLTLAISDVVGDDLSVIASGPTVPDDTTLDEALSIIERYEVTVPESVIKALKCPDNETPKPEDSIFENTESRLIASPIISLKAAAAIAREEGLTPLMLGDALEGEARESGTVHAGIAKAVADNQLNLNRPVVILSGGENTVTMKGEGRGGPNTEFLLGMTKSLKGRQEIYALACDTDGVDGSEDNAGAVIYPDTLLRAKKRGLDLEQFLKNNDAYTFFHELGDLVISGPTLTNVNDFRAILVVDNSELQTENVGYA